MPQRMLSLFGVLLGVVGLAVLGLAALGGRDLRRAMASGPRWRRKLVAAGFLLLGAAGVSVGLRDISRDDDGGPRPVDTADSPTPTAEAFWAGSLPPPSRGIESANARPPAGEVEKVFRGPLVMCYSFVGLGPVDRGPRSGPFDRPGTTDPWPSDSGGSQIGRRLRLLAVTERGGLAPQVVVKVLSAIESDVADLRDAERTEAASLLRLWLASTGKEVEARLRQRLQALDGTGEPGAQVAKQRQAIQAALDSLLELRRSYGGTSPVARP